jgi:hypothetical protein
MGMRMPFLAEQDAFLKNGNTYIIGTRLSHQLCQRSKP